MIIARELHKSDFEIANLNESKILYYDYLFYGNDGEVKFPIEKIVIDLKRKLDSILLLLE